MALSSRFVVHGSPEVLFHSSYVDSFFFILFFFYLPAVDASLPVLTHIYGSGTATEVIHAYYEDLLFMND